MEFLILGAALLFFYFALQHFLTLCRTPDPTRTMILFIYTFLCGVYLFYEGWPAFHTGSRFIN